MRINISVVSITFDFVKCCRTRYLFVTLLLFIFLTAIYFIYLLLNSSPNLLIKKTLARYDSDGFIQQFFPMPMYNIIFISSKTVGDISVKCFNEMNFRKENFSHYWKSVWKNLSEVCEEHQSGNSAYRACFRVCIGIRIPRSLNDRFEIREPLPVYPF